MNSVGELHQRAMEMADRALEARRRGDEEQAQACFREALAYERRAAETVALAVECGELREAERLIAIALSGNPPRGDRRGTA